MAFLSERGEGCTTPIYYTLVCVRCYPSFPISKKLLREAMAEVGEKKILTRGRGCGIMGLEREEGKEKVMKIIESKEMRDMAFMVAAIVMAIMICVTSIGNGNMFGIVVSIVLLALLCVGLGYQYCKNEDKIYAVMRRVSEEKAKPKEKEKAKEKVPVIDLDKLTLLGVNKKGEAKSGEAE